MLVILEDDFAINLNNLISIHRVYIGKEPCGIVFTMIDGSRKEIKTSRAVEEVVRYLDSGIKI